MIILKTDAEIEDIQRAGKLVSAVHRTVASNLVPGVGLSELESLVAEIYRQNDAEPAFSLTDQRGRTIQPAACLSVNTQIGTPADHQRTLQSGDVLNLDTGCRCDGWCAEAAWSYPVGEVDGVRRNLLEVLRQTFDLLIQRLERGPSWDEIARQIGRHVQEAGLRLIPEIVGHGIGRELHEDPQLSWNPRPPGGVDSIVLQPGMVLAVECGITSGCGLLRPLPTGGWETYDGAPCVHGEMTLAVTDRGIDVLSRPIV